MAPPQDMVIHDTGLTVLNPELKPEDTLVDIVFVHGLGGNARGTWTYKGPKQDSVSHGPQKELVHRPLMNETTEVIGQSDAEKMQEERVGQQEHGRRPFLKRLKKTIPGLSSLSSSSKGKAKERTQPQKVDAKGKSPAKENVFFWPQNLPEACARARIMTFGFDSSVTKFFGGAANQNTFYDHARDLLGALVRKRTYADRPIIFVAHSLGGLVVKQMLFEAERSLAFPERCKVYSSTKALFFLGTPHSGSDWAQWGEIARSIAALIFDTNPSSIKHLEVNGESLMQLQNNFDKLIWLRTFWIYTFIEAEGFKPVPFLNAKIVKAEYAKAGDPGRERVETISANHKTMCRFWGTEDPNYDKVAGELDRFVYQDIVQAEVEANQKRKFEESFRQEGRFYQNDSVDRCYAASLTLQCVALLKSLDYEGRHNRKDQLWETEANSQTTVWVWDSSFADWASNDGALFWICGKPASGKSTLMEYISRGNKLQDHLRQGISEEWTVVRHFFFDFGVSKDFRNNFEGFLRSLLYQLIDGSQGGDVSSREIEPEQRWSSRELKDKLTLALKKRSNPICILLDGLDEYQDNKWDLVDFLRETADYRVKLCVASRPDTVFNAAFKDVPTIRMQEWNTPAINKMVDLKIRESRVEFNNDEVVELAESISRKADGVFLWARFALDELRSGWSEGLNLEELQKRLENVPERLEDIYARIIKNIEPEQKKKAAHMLQLVCYAKRTLTLEELYVATHRAAGEQGPHLRQTSATAIEQFAKSILAHTGGILEVFRSPESDEEYEGSILHESQNFASSEAYESQESNDSEAYESQEANDFFVNVIHRTVRTYLDSSGWSQVLDAKHAGMSHAQVLWLRICAGMFPPSLRPLSPDLHHTLSLSSPDECLPLRGYAARYMLHHAAEVEQGLGVASYSILQPSMSDSFVSYYEYYAGVHGLMPSHLQIFTKSLRPLHLAVIHGLDRYVEGFTSIFDKDSSPGSPNWDDVFYLKNSNHLYPGMSLLGFAICCTKGVNGAAQIRIVTILLDRCSRAHDAEMILALKYAPLEVVELLLPYWPDGKMVFSSSFRFDQEFKSEVLDCGLLKFCQERFDVGPMWYIARRQHRLSIDNDKPELIDLFVLRGEDINAQCGPFGTALHSALLRQSTPPFNEDGDGMWRLLVAKGADVNATGPLGTPLEFVWRLVNTAYLRHRYHLTIWEQVIREFIENGAVNNRCDPNGSIPSREQMLSFRKLDWEEIAERQRLYRGDPVEDDTSVHHTHEID